MTRLARPWTSWAKMLLTHRCADPAADSGPGIESLLACSYELPESNLLALSLPLGPFWMITVCPPAQLDWHSADCQEGRPPNPLASAGAMESRSSCSTTAGDSSSGRVLRKSSSASPFIHPSKQQRQQTTGLTLRSITHQTGSSSNDPTAISNDSQSECSNVP